MGERKRKITIELTERDVQEAVAAWLNEQPPFADHWSPEDVKLSAKKEWRGNGMAEKEVWIPTVIAEQSQ